MNRSSTSTVVVCFVTVACFSTGCARPARRFADQAAGATSRAHRTMERANRHRATGSVLGWQPARRGARRPMTSTRCSVSTRPDTAVATTSRALTVAEADLAIAGRNAQFEPVTDVAERGTAPSSADAPCHAEVKAVAPRADPCARHRGSQRSRPGRPPTGFSCSVARAPRSRRSWSTELHREPASCCRSDRGVEASAFLPRARAAAQRSALALLQPRSTPVVGSKRMGLFDFHPRMYRARAGPDSSSRLPFMLGDAIVGRGLRPIRRLELCSSRRRPPSRGPARDGRGAGASCRTSRWWLGIWRHRWTKGDLARLGAVVLGRPSLWL